jgi:hypothetical protein
VKLGIDVADGVQQNLVVATVPGDLLCVADAAAQVVERRKELARADQ